MKATLVCLLVFFASTFFPLKAGAVTQTSVSAIADAQVKDSAGFQQDPFTGSRGLTREHRPDPNNSGGPIEASASATVDLVDSHASATAAANAQIGKLGVSISGIGSGAPRLRAIPHCCEGGQAYASAFATAQWLDTITLSSASRGNAVRAVYNVFLDGELGGVAFGPEAFAQVNFELENADQSLLQIPQNEIRAIVTKTATIDIVEDIPGGFRVTLIPPTGPFTIGLKMTLQGNGNTDSSFISSRYDDHTFGFIGEVGHSLTWGGLEGVFDAVTGEELDDWTITSESGFDYSKPFGVPEPASIALVGVASCFWPRRVRARV